MLAQPARRLLLLLAVLLLAGGLGDANGGATPDASVAARAGRQTHALVASSARRMLASASRSSGRRAARSILCDLLLPAASLRPTTTFRGHPFE